MSQYNHNNHNTPNRDWLYVQGSFNKYNIKIDEKSLPFHSSSQSSQFNPLEVDEELLLLFRIAVSCCSMVGVVGIVGVLTFVNLFGGLLVVVASYVNKTHMQDGTNKTPNRQAKKKRYASARYHPKNSWLISFLDYLLHPFNE